MKLIFKLKDNKHINIINEKDGRIVGRIFTPSGTGEVIEDAIQICGFSRAFEIWGCGVFGDNEGKSLQDIQLLFKDFKPIYDGDMKNTEGSMKGVCFGTKKLPIMDKDGCDRCFHWRDNFGNCKCSELKVHRRFKDIEKWELRNKNYKTKEKIIKGLK